MTLAQKNRIIWISLVSASLIGAAIFVISALNQSMMYFVNPTELMTKSAGTKLRLGGVVENGSIKRESKDLTVTFKVTDFTATVPVHYQGITPDLFKEGQGVVADGIWDGTTFQALKLLAKHDENYMPPSLQKVK